jgi:tetratricopeptide (TPR) repeat protein
MVLGAHHFIPEAVVCFAAAERFEPGEPRWPYFRGLALQLEGYEAEAVPPLRRAVELCPRQPDAPRLRLGEVLLKQDRLDEAEAQFRDLLAHDPGQAPAHLGLARVALARGDPAGARDPLRPSLDSPFTRKAAHLLLAEVEQRLGDAAAAGQALRRAGSLPPDAPWPDPFRDEVEALKADRRTRGRRAEMMLGRGQAGEAQFLLEELDNDHPGTSALAKGRRLLDAKEYQAAEHSFREAVLLAPDFAQAHFWLGVALLDQDDAVGAAACFREAVRLQPQHAAAYEKLGLCLEKRGDRAGALEALRAAVRYLPQSADLHRRLGKLLAAEGERGAALEQLDRALALNPDDAEARELAGRLRAGPTPKEP